MEVEGELFEGHKKEMLKEEESWWKREQWRETEGQVPRAFFHIWNLYLNICLYDLLWREK